MYLLSYTHSQTETVQQSWNIFQKTIQNNWSLQHVK